MIYATVNVTIGEYESVCDKLITLYRGDKNVEIRFVMHGNRFTVLDNTYAQMIIKRPSAASIFSEPALIQNDTVVFLITDDMIDELKEIGAYTFQIRLYDDNMVARVTLPPCYSTLFIEKPIAVEGESIVNLAMVNDSAVMLADTTISEEDIFTEDGQYNKTMWKDGDLITDAKLNKIEEALHYINENGGGGGGATAPYISTELPENIIVPSGNNFDLSIDYYSPNFGKGTLKVFINDVESLSKSIEQGVSTTIIDGDNFSKGTNRVVVYVIDRVGVMSNSLVFYLRYGSTEITSDFDPYSAYDYGSIIRYYFTPTSVDTSLSLSFYMSIDGTVQKPVSCKSDVRGYFTFPMNLSAGKHYCEAYVIDSENTKSNVLKFNLIILQNNTLVVASDTADTTIEEGAQLTLDYKVYMKNNSSFITEVYVDNNLVNTGTCGLDFNEYKTSSLTEGTHSIKLVVYDVTRRYKDSIIWTVVVTASAYEMLQPVNAGAIFIGTAVNKSNADERRQYFIGYDQEGNEILGTLTNFAFNSESGWVDDELIISGNSYAEIPIQPLANNAKYGFTLDIEFTSKQIGVPDAEVLTLWNDETNCGVKITTEKLILRSSNGNQCDLYFTDNERTHVMFIIDRQELKAKIYLNGVMCEAFHLNDYTVDGVAYLDDFTVNSNIVLGGLNTNGYCKIRNIRVYQVALTTDEIINNFISCEIDKSKQRELVNFQKGDDLPTLYVYCDFSGLGKDDKKPCKIVYNSTNEELYGKSFNLDHKQSQLQYQGTSSMAYPIKNYRLNLRDENGDKWYYTLPTAQPECRFTLKADFMSSGHWTNTGMAKFINDKLYNYNVNDEKSMNPFKWEHVQNGGKVSDFRETIHGFPCRLILVNDGETPLNTGQNEPTPGNTKDMGIFNFNNDKDNVTTLGFNSDIFPNCASYEVTANSDTSAGAFMSYSPIIPIDYYHIGGDYSFSVYLPSNLFLTKDTNIINSDVQIVQIDYHLEDKTWKDYKSINNISATVESTEYSYIRIKFLGIPSYITFNDIRYPIGNQVSDNYATFESNISPSDELAYLKESFELRHPDEDDVAEDWGFMGIPGEEGTGLKALIDWVDNCTDEEFVRDFEQHFHKDYTLRYFCLVTLIGAVDNLGKNMMLDTADNKIYFPRFYDIDTICSYDNSGQLKFDVDIEMEQGYWNTSSSRLWTRIRDLMHDDIVTTYNNMRQNGVSYENMMHYIYDEQIAKIPQTYYNKDYDVKYAPFADSYIGMAHGDTYEHVKRWLKQRFTFVDTLFDYAPSYNNDILTIRANTTELMTLEIETYTPVYLHLSWYNGQMDKKKIDGKVSVEFSGKAQAATDQEVLIYSGSNVKSIKGIQSANPNRLILGSATKLTELDASNCPLLAEINMNKANLSPHEYLNKVNLSNCPLLEGNLRLNNSPLIQELDIRGTNITGMNLPSSIRNLQVLKLPNTMTELTLNDAGMLHTLEFDEGVALQSISMTNCNALTNVVNFDLLQTPSIVLNNSYNTAAELYFRDTTNLSLSNMSNLERVIFTPNNEYETFELINVANAPDYKVTTFNCPKLSTFMTTAPYRESFNDCGTKDKEISIETHDVFIGGDDRWTGKDAIIYISEGTVALTKQYKSSDYIETAPGNIYTLTSDDASSYVGIVFFDSAKNILEGSKGLYDVRTYTATLTAPSGTAYVRYFTTNGVDFDTVLSIVSYDYIQIKEYGDIQPNTTFTANSIDISSTQFTDVKLLCTTDTNTLKLPTTVRNFYCDSSFDLDTDHLEDGEYDLVHGELVEPYTTDYKDEVIYNQEQYFEDILVQEIGIRPGYLEWTRPTYTNPSASNDYYVLNEPLKVIGGTLFKNTGAGLHRFSEYDENLNLIKYGGIDGYTTTILDNNTRYIALNIRSGQESKLRISFTGALGKTPNLIPSSADGSLIFSMYAPNNTVAPASGTWDLKGLKFDNFHTFGMNNDVKPSEGIDYYILDALIGDRGTVDDVGTVLKTRLATCFIPKALYNTPTDVTIPNWNNSINKWCLFSDGTLKLGDPLKLECDYVALQFYTTSDVTIENTNKSTFKMNGILFSINIIDNTPDNASKLNGCNAVTSISSLSMPARYDDYNITIKNANISPKTHNTMLYPLLVNEDNPITGTLDYTNYAGKHLSWSFAYTDEDYVNIIQPKDELINSYEYRYNAFYDTEYEFVNPYEIAKYTSSASGVLPRFNTEFTYTYDETDNGDGTYTTKIYADSLDNLPTSISFNGKTTLLTVDKLITSNVTSMYAMFNNCNNLTSLDVSGFNTVNVTDMSYMFQYCQKLTSLDVTGFETGKVTNMSTMFSGCKKLTSLDVSGFDTAKVSNMSYMFYDCSSLTSLDVSGFDTSDVTNISNMFNGCSGLTSLDVSGFDTSNVTDMGSMFRNCSSLTTLDLSGFDTSKITNMQYVFNKCENLEQLKGDFVLNNVDCAYMFQNCSKAPDLSEFKMSGTVRGANYMFNAFGFNNIPLATSLDLSDIALTDGCGISQYTFFRCGVVNIYPFTNINSHCHLGNIDLPQEVLLRFINNLAEATTSPTLTLGATNLAKLTEDQIAIATNKGWTVV